MVSLGSGRWRTMLLLAIGAAGLLDVGSDAKILRCNQEYDKEHGESEKRSLEIFRMIEDGARKDGTVRHLLRKSKDDLINNNKDFFLDQDESAELLSIIDEGEEKEAQVMSLRRDESGRHLANGAKAKKEGPIEIVIPIVFHVMTTVDGWGAIPLEAIEKQIYHLNQSFAGYGNLTLETEKAIEEANKFGTELNPKNQTESPTPKKKSKNKNKKNNKKNKPKPNKLADEPVVDTFIRFTLQTVVVHENDSWFTFCWLRSVSTAMKQATAVDPKRYLNVWTCKPDTFMGDVSIFPEDLPEDSPLQGVVIHYLTLPATENYKSIPIFSEGDTLVHEVGHYLGLQHTFQGGCNGKGDFVGDTPAEKTPALGESCRAKSPRDTCKEQKGLDPVTNFMDYSDDICLESFTNLQAARMQTMVKTYKPTLIKNSPRTCVAMGERAPGNARSWQMCETECFTTQMPDKSALADPWCYTDTKRKLWGVCCCLDTGCTPGRNIYGFTPRPTTLRPTSTQIPTSTQTPTGSPSHMPTLPLPSVHPDENATDAPVSSNGTSTAPSADKNNTDHYFVA